MSGINIVETIEVDSLYLPVALYDDVGFVG